jgi:hypothetical protein
MSSAYIPPKGNNNGEKCIKTLSEILKEEKKMKAIKKMLESENPKYINSAFENWMKRHNPS